MNEKIPSLQDLEKQYNGRTIAEFFMYSYSDAGNKNSTASRFISLNNELQSRKLSDDCNQFMKEMIIPNLWNKSFWKKDAGDYVYMYYDYFVLGYGDMFKRIPSDEGMFTILNCITYGIVLMMYDDQKLYKHIKRTSKKFTLF